MELFRNMDHQLIEWNNNRNRKPLLLLGARQVGKTHSVKNFAYKVFKNKFIYINFILNNEYKEILQNKNNPREIIETLSIYKKINIDENWLIIFDEIQEMPNIRTSFKLFNEAFKEIRIIGLGSYLGSSLNNEKEGFPVGQVDIMNMFPLNFMEYLKSQNNEILIKNIEKNNILDHIHESLINELKNYLIIGGMPEILISYFQDNNLIEANKIKNNILFGYRADITKYIENNNEKIKAAKIFDNIISFLMRENKSFTLSLLNKNARYRDYENALDSLLATHLIIKVNKIKKIHTTLKINQIENKFKLFYSDHGFISLLTNVNKTLLWKYDESPINSFIKGSLGENFVMQELLSKINHDAITYHSFSYDGRNYEVDLMLEDTEGNIIPCEMKLRDNFKTKSLNKYINLNKPKFAIIFSLKKFNINIIDNTKIIKIPLYMLSNLKFIQNRIDLNDFLS